MLRANFIFHKKYQKNLRTKSVKSVCKKRPKSLEVGVVAKPKALGDGVAARPNVLSPKALGLVAMPNPRIIFIKLIRIQIIIF